MIRTTIILVTCATLGCATVRSSAVPTTSEHHTRFAGPVAVSATRDPSGGTEVGVVEATGGPTIEELIPEFIERVAQLGGNFARIDQITTRYQWIAQPVMQQYNCGSYRFPMYCNRSYMQSQEVATMRAVGRAFRVGLP